MGVIAASGWTPGTDLTFAIPMGGGRILAVELRADWLKEDRSGRPLLLPPAIRFVDRLRAIFGAQATLTPGFIVSLREAMGLTQEQFGRKLKVSTMTVSRWERGRMKPSDSAANAIRKLRQHARRQGVMIDPERR
jgi:DNA-binding transcriptional regulator YiaG